MSAFARLIKKMLPTGRRLRRPLTGMFRTVRLHLDLASETQIWLGFYERETHRRLVRLAGSSGSCIDIGAGKGELVCWWLRQFPGRPIVAVEPNPVELAVLHQNVAANFPAPPGALTVWPGCAGPGPPATHRELAELCASLPDPVFIKLDIDGGEASLLENARTFLAAHPCRMLIEVHSVDLENACRSLLDRCGYRIEVVDFAWWRRWLREHRPIPHNRWLVAEPQLPA